MKLLIVDDQQSVHLFLEKMIHWDTLGITHIEHAYNGMEALESIEKNPPTIMLLDIKMPLLDGLQLVNELNSRQLPLKIILLSAYAEFEYARLAMSLGIRDYLLKPIDPNEVQEKIQVLINELRSGYELSVRKPIKKILSGEQITENTMNALEEDIMKLRITIYCCTVLLCEGHTASRWTERLSACELFDSELKFQINTEQIVIIHKLPEGKDPRSNVAKKLSEFINYYDDRTGVHLGISTPYQGIKDLYSAYLEALEALRSMFYIPKQQLFSYQGDNFSTLESSEKNTVELYIKDILQGTIHQKQLEQLINNFFQECTSIKLHPDIVRNLCYQLYFQISGTRILSSESPDFNKVKTVQELRKLVSDILLKLLNENKSLAEKTEEELALDIKTYIDMHPAADLSLETVSSKCFMSKFKLSRLFKSYIGENYWDYVIRIRMTRAAYLLKHSNLKMYEIAEAVGYDAVTHFSSSFKKFYSVSPSEYRTNGI